jgi:hypothetical protein
MSPYRFNDVDDDTTMLPPPPTLKASSSARADVRTVFTEEKGHVNPHTCELEDGWWCDICK